MLATKAYPFLHKMQLRNWLDFCQALQFCQHLLDQNLKLYNVDHVLSWKWAGFLLTVVFQGESCFQGEKNI